MIEHTFANVKRSSASNGRGPTKGIDRPTGRFIDCPPENARRRTGAMVVAVPATDRGGETRRRILDVAAEAFAERGYAGTSLSEVLKASGVTKGGFYFHFPSKEALALAPSATSRSSGRPL